MSDEEIKQLNWAGRMADTGVLVEGSMNTENAGTSLRFQKNSVGRSNGLNEQHDPVVLQSSHPHMHE